MSCFAASLASSADAYFADAAGRLTAPPLTVVTSLNIVLPESRPSYHRNVSRRRDGGGPTSPGASIGPASSRHTGVPSVPSSRIHHQSVAGDSGLDAVGAQVPVVDAARAAPHHRHGLAHTGRDRAQIGPRPVGEPGPRPARAHPAADGARAARRDRARRCSGSVRRRPGRSAHRRSSPRTRSRSRPGATTRARRGTGRSNGRHGSVDQHLERKGAQHAVDARAAEVRRQQGRLGTAGRRRAPCAETPSAPGRKPVRGAPAGPRTPATGPRRAPARAAHSGGRRTRPPEPRGKPTICAPRRSPAWPSAAHAGS